MSDREGETPAGRTMLVVILLSMLLQAGLMLFGFGCVPKPPPPTPPVPPGIPYCNPNPELDPDRICKGLFTRSGAPCVSCGGAAGCFDRQTGIYCVSGPCLSDAECVPERPDVLGSR